MMSLEGDAWPIVPGKDYQRPDYLQSKSPRNVQDALPSGMA